MKQRLLQVIFIMLFLAFYSVIIGQDTIIEHQDFTLEIQRVTESKKRTQYSKTGKNSEIIEFSWVNNSLGYIVKKWVSFMELEENEYRIEGELGTKNDFFIIKDKEGISKMIQTRDTALLRKLFMDDDVVVTYVGYDVSLKRKNTAIESAKYINKEAFEIFCDIMELEIEYVIEERTFWTISLIDPNSHAISQDQEKYWRRTETEESIYYERIPFRRVADLLGRKLEAFVKPIPFNAQKFDIKMPKSDDVFDLKYAMIEHGLELMEVTEEVEVMVIRTKNNEN